MKEKDNKKTGFNYSKYNKLFHSLFNYFNSSIENSNECFLNNSDIFTRNLYYIYEYTGKQIGDFGHEGNCEFHGLIYFLFNFDQNILVHNFSDDYTVKYLSIQFILILVFVFLINVLILLLIYFVIRVSLIFLNLFLILIIIILQFYYPKNIIRIIQNLRTTNILITMKMKIIIFGF